LATFKQLSRLGARKLKLVRAKSYERLVRGPMGQSPMSEIGPKQTLAETPPQQVKRTFRGNVVDFPF